MPPSKAIPAVSVTFAKPTGPTSNELGMRPMQERAYSRRGEQYLLIKSPPASGKSRALMFVALDKLERQGLKQAIIVVPEKSIGSSFHNEPLSKFGFWADWEVEPRWNLCNAPGEDGGKVDAVESFLQSDARILICTHATFRFAVDRFGVEAFDGRLIAIDEFHHVSANPDNKLGTHLNDFMTRDKCHVVAMTGSYFRGDAEAVLHPDDEARFASVTYTYYEQIAGYKDLKHLDLGYFFYTGVYTEEILEVLNPDEKTILHIPNVNSKESTKEKIKEVEHIIDSLGEWQGTDPETGFQLVKRPDGKVLRIADLVDDDPNKREKVSAALKDPAHKNDRDHVDLIIALGMAKEGFDWIWCEHALTIGYRSSLTEIVQIIGRATRDAPGKSHARFTNLIAAPDATDQDVTEAINDTLKAIAASLLMEQVMAPKFDFKPRGGTAGDVTNVGEVTHQGSSAAAMQLEIKGLKEPKSDEAKKICAEEIQDVITSFLQDTRSIERGLFDEELVPEELTQVRLGKIIADSYPALDDEDHEAIRQRAVVQMNLLQEAKKQAAGEHSQNDAEPTANISLLEGVRRFAMDVRELDIDLIDRINPFGEAYAILSKTMTEDRLRQIQAIVSAKKVHIDLDEARALAKRAIEFKKERGRLPQLTANDPWERRMAEGIAVLQRHKKEADRA